jgi:SAM-dependent methyltransferase
MICGGQEHKSITVRENRLCIGDSFRYDVCTSCGLLTLINKPKDMEKYYQEYSYFQKERPRSRSVIDPAYLRVSKLLLQPMQRFSPKDEEKNKAILDVGCARGQYLKTLKQRGFTDLHGIEISPEAVRNKADPSLDIQCNSLDDYRTTKRYDIITLNQVFEHFDKPRPMLRKLRSLLTDEGLLVMSFPNSASAAKALFGQHWPGHDAPRHYFTYSPKNISMLAAQEQMQIIRIKHISRPSQFLGSFQYLYNEKTGTKASLENGFFRNSKILDIAFMLPAYLVNTSRIGDNIEVYLRKKPLPRQAPTRRKTMSRRRIRDKTQAAGHLARR